MTRGIVKQTSLKLSLLFTFILAASLTLTGCGSDSSSHDAASGSLAGADSVLIEAATLKGMIDAGRLNNDGADEIVLLDVTTIAQYDAGHIAGAQLWNYGADLHAMDRPEGPVLSPYMVIGGVKMNAMLAQFGIEEDTTIVLTSSDPNSFRPARAYFTLRYWGFARERLKVLNGFNGVWDQSALETEATADITASTYTVADLGSFTGDERMSLSEMVEAVSNRDGIPVDFRGDNETFPADGSSFAFYGRLTGGKFFAHAGANVQYSPVLDADENVLAAKDMRYKSADEIVAMLKNAGIDGSKKVYAYCTSGYNASAGFLIIDGILGWDAAVYDGSWLQWGKMSDNASFGLLDPGSEWAVDYADTMDNIDYNPDASAVGALSGYNPAIDFATGNQIEDADYDSVYGAL